MRPKAQYSAATPTSPSRGSDSAIISAVAYQDRA
jgi:hypothetical protein